VLVVLLHAAAVAALASYRHEIQPPAPPVMVSLISAEPVPVAPQVTLPKPLPAAPRPVARPKLLPMPAQSHADHRPVQPESQMAFSRPDPVPSAVEETAPAPSEPVSKPAPAPTPHPVEPIPAPAPKEATPIEPPRFHADYLDNPAPRYPLLSRRAGEQGRVLLRVRVSAAGAALEVNLHQSCGYERLDQSALETVRQWKFVPARQGDKAVEAWVIVPIQFNLKG
jgi:protein TonB